MKKNLVLLLVMLMVVSVFSIACSAKTEESAPAPASSDAKPVAEEVEFLMILLFQQTIVLSAVLFLSEIFSGALAFFLLQNKGYFE